MKYLKFSFVAFGLFEILAAFSVKTSFIDLQPISTDPVVLETLHYANGFVNAIFSIGVIALFGPFIKERMGLLAFCIGFALYNALAAYGSYLDMAVAEHFKVGFYIHVIFTLLFLLMTRLVARRE